MRVMHGNTIVEMSGDELHQRRSGYQTVALDIGTGDGRFAYRHARAHPDTFCIGLDASAENIGDYATKSIKKPSRGGVPNVLYVIANAEALPPELHGLAHTITINFPWGSLLRGVAVGDSTLLHAVARAGVPGARVDILVNYAVFYDPVPLDVRDLPELTDTYVEDVLTPAYAAAGLRLFHYERVGKATMKDVQTTWSKRLAYGKRPHTVWLRAEVVAPMPDSE